MGDIHIIRAPTFFLNRGPARSKSGPGFAEFFLVLNGTVLRCE